MVDILSAVVAFGDPRLELELVEFLALLPERNQFAYFAAFAEEILLLISVAGDLLLFGVIVAYLELASPPASILDH